MCPSINKPGETVWSREGELSTSHFWSSRPIRLFITSQVEAATAWSLQSRRSSCRRNSRNTFWDSEGETGGNFCRPSTTRRLKTESCLEEAQDWSSAGWTSRVPHSYNLVLSTRAAKQEEKSSIPPPPNNSNSSLAARFTIFICWLTCLLNDLKPNTPVTPWNMNK